MITYDKQQGVWTCSLKLKQYKEEENAAELIQHMIDMMDIVEQSEIEEAWLEAYNSFMTGLQKSGFDIFMGNDLIVKRKGE